VKFNSANTEKKNLPRLRENSTRIRPSSKLVPKNGISVRNEMKSSSIT